MPTIDFFRRESRFSDSLVEVGIVVFAVVRKGRWRDRETVLDWLAVKTPKARRLGPSSYQKPDWHHDEPEMKMPTPNGRWHGHEPRRIGCNYRWQGC
jgi:hypothetical protein